VQHANLKYLPEIFVIETSQNLPRNPIKIIWIDQSIRAFHAINPVYLSQPLHGIFFNKQLESRAKETIRIQRTRITGWLQKQISKNRRKSICTDLSRRRSATSFTVSSGIASRAWHATSQITATTCFRTFSSKSNNRSQSAAKKLTKI
jgi:hypothetical protein